VTAAGTRTRIEAFVTSTAIYLHEASLAGQLGKPWVKMDLSVLPGTSGASLARRRIGSHAQALRRDRAAAAGEGRPRHRVSRLFGAAAGTAQPDHGPEGTRALPHPGQAAPGRDHAR
jgi:hypothetical protein